MKNVKINKKSLLRAFLLTLITKDNIIQKKCPQKDTKKDKQKEIKSQKEKNYRECQNLYTYTYTVNSVC